MHQGHLQNLIDGTLRFVEVASFGMKRACDEIVVHRQMQKKASAAAPALLDLMLKSGAVRPDQKEEAAAMLGDHAATMGLLKNAIEDLVALKSGQPLPGSKQARDLGHGEDADGNRRPGGGYDSLHDSRVGLKTAEKKASDLAILAVLDSPSR